MSAIVESDPEILGGKPVVGGTRIPVDLVLELINVGCSANRIVEEYPELSKESVMEIAKLAKIVHEAISYERAKALVEA